MAPRGKKKPQIPKPSPPSVTIWGRQFTNVDPETAAELRRKGCDPHKLDLATECKLSHIYANLPTFPVYHGKRLPPVLDAPDDVDRISLLSSQLRREIVSRLPVKDGARTAVLSKLWREIWRSTPLVLIDAHLLPEGPTFRPTPADSPAITAAVSSILEAHRGPFRCVHLVCSHMASYLPQLERWLQLLDAKGVHELVLVNRPWPQDVPLPPTVFTIATLTRLYLGQWKLPDMAFTMRAFSLPNLRELGICCVFMKHGDVNQLIARCPVLEILNILGGMEGLRLQLASPTLRCVQICLLKTVDISVLKTPRLERLVLYGSCKTARVRIGDAPMLHAIGYLEPGQLLQIGGTIITPGIRSMVSSGVLSSVKVLALNVHFGDRDDVKMLPTFLSCFRNMEALHIKCEKSDKLTSNLTLNSWEKSGSIEKVVSHVKEMTISEFRGEPSALSFLELFFRSAPVLKIAVIVFPNPRFTLLSEDVMPKLEKIAKKAAPEVLVGILQSNCPEGGQPWSLQTGADLSVADPFSVGELMLQMDDKEEDKCGRNKDKPEGNKEAKERMKMEADSSSLRDKIDQMMKSKEALTMKTLETKLLITEPRKLAKLQVQREEAKRKAELEERMKAKYEERMLKVKEAKAWEDLLAKEKAMWWKAELMERKRLLSQGREASKRGDASTQGEPPMSVGGDGGHSTDA